MRVSRQLVQHPEFRVRAVSCHDDHRRWSHDQPPDGFGLVLVRSGRFRLRANGQEQLADPTMGYLQTPQTDLRFAHPRGGDECTAIDIVPGLWHSVFSGHPGRHAVTIDARLEFAHRRLLRSARSGDSSFAAAESLVELLTQSLCHDGRSAPFSPRMAALADAAREAILSDAPQAGGLMELARELGVSPFHLSRVFRAHIGVSLTRYRNRVRIGRALARLEAGESSLARLAADLGFSDQSHLTRIMTEHIGHTPRAARGHLILSS